MTRTRPRHLLALVTTALLTATLLGAPGASSAAAGGPRGSSAAEAPLAAVTAETSATPEALLQRARRVVAPEPGEQVTPVDGEHATFLMRDLFSALPDLDPEERALAEVILARPTDGASDPQGNGYSVPSVKRCTKRVCLHHVRSTADAPPSEAWAKYSLKILDKVYRFETGKLGYRKPVADRTFGGNSKFDVYLKDLGTGLYGYCVPEYYKPGSRKVASGYCVVDNDFSSTQFSGKPKDNLRVTLAHEFFHAVQFAYDFTEDQWFMESTAVWMEERFADAVNDNRQYLPIGQTRLPHVPLDTFADPGVHYGNWTFWEYLSSRMGNRVVRDVWDRADANQGRPDAYSAQALRGALAQRGGLTRRYTAFAAANLMPAKNYAEGEAWPAAITRGTRELGKERRGAGFRVRVDHLASASYVVRPDSSMGKKWKLRVVVKAPARGSSPGAYVTVRTKKGALQRKPVTLTRKGRGKVVVPFSATRVRAVYLTVANASTRYRCGRGTTYSCRGVARDDDRRFSLKVRTVR